MTTTDHFVDTLLGAVGDRIAPSTVALRRLGGPGVLGRLAPWAERLGPRAGQAEEVTYGALAAAVEATADALRADGMVPGDRVLFSIRPRPEGVLLCLAVLRAGGSIVFVDPGSTPELFAARIAAARPRWAATEALLYAASSGLLRRVARSRGLLLPDYGRLPLRHLYSGSWLPGVPRGARRVSSLAGVRGTRPSPQPERLPGPQRGAGEGRADAEALVVFTSGTTSDPRAVVHTTRTLGGALDLFRQVVDLRAGQVVHTDQMFLGLPTLLAGGTWEIPARTPAQDPAAFARGVAGADASFLVPADATAYLDAIEAGALGSGDAASAGPRTLLLGAAPVRRALLERAQRILPGTRWLAVYGATEILPAAVVEASEKVAADVDGDLVGAPLAGISAVLDVSGADDADDNPGGVVGELVLSGPSLMAGYLADLDAGAPPVREHRTGDLAWLDDEGRIVLVGRTRDMIIRGTLNIYPGLFEPRVRELPGVGDALLVGVPVPDGDERVVLVVTPTAAGRAEGEPALTPGTPLARSVAAALPGVLDHGALPDLVVEASHVPLHGRSRKPDRRVLAALAAPLLEGARA
ncbi:class I adenylate-forming enzyme family protein [Antribacter gilvus]|uniref:class I adenylate-forming enzyme family protein n=1 Tax=Antribacter gilvus TaxID=2304675 RepID=UPI000F788458|nr:class I adenylate-forming enzyme family protein [Antribacter gilvus]